jgi:hypothetical protein
MELPAGDRPDERRRTLGQADGGNNYERHPTMYRRADRSWRVVGIARARCSYSHSDAPDAPRFNVVPVGPVGPVYVGAANPVGPDPPAFG